MGRGTEGIRLERRKDGAERENEKDFRIDYYFR